MKLCMRLEATLRLRLGRGLCWVLSMLMVEAQTEVDAKALIQASLHHEARGFCRAWQFRSYVAFPFRHFELSKAPESWNSEALELRI